MSLLTSCYPREHKIALKPLLELLDLQNLITCMNIGGGTGGGA
jgi:N-acetyl-gamma-glutamylphosphate reductase